MAVFNEQRAIAMVDGIGHRRLTRRAVVGRAAVAGAGAAAAGPFFIRHRAGAQEKTQVRLATWAGAEEAAELQGVIDQVNAEASTFEIVSEPQPAEYYVKLQTTIAGGTAADLYWLSQEYIANYADNGALLDVTDRLAASEQPVAQLDDYFAPILQTAQYDDKTWGLPWISQPVVLYYNPDLFAAAEIAPPDESWTWDNLKEAAATLTDAANGVYGVSFNGWPPAQMFVWQNGGEVISEDLSSCPIDSEEAIAAADFYASIIYNEQFAPSEATIDEQGFAEMAKAGKVAMFFGGAADDLDYAYTKDPANAKLQVALVPQGPAGRTTFSWTASTVINGATENPDAAYDALLALTEGIHHWKIVAPRQSLATADVIAESVPDKAASAETILKALPDMRAFRIIPEQIEWDRVWNEEYLYPLFHGEGSAEELAPEIRPFLEDLLP